MAPLMRLLPFARATTPLQAATYLLGISLFSIAFLVFLNSSISFVITDRIGVKTGVGNIVGTLGFVDELVALVACPAWGLVSDRLGVRLVAVLGYTIIALALVLVVQATNVYPQLLLARILFALGASAATTMVTAILPSLTDDSDTTDPSSSPISRPLPKATPIPPDGILAAQRANPRDSALSVESQLTITPERFAASLQRSGAYGSLNAVAVGGDSTPAVAAPAQPSDKPSRLAGLVGLFTGCGALLALVLFLPLPAQFARSGSVTMAEAVARSFDVVAGVALLVAGFVFVGLRNLRGEHGKGWSMLRGRRVPAANLGMCTDADAYGCTATSPPARPYWRLLHDSVVLGFTDADIALGYLGGFVARASTVAISLFVPLFVNAYFISHGFCQGAPDDPSPELKKECRAAYVLAAILTGVAQLLGLLCAPLFGCVASSRRSRVLAAAATEARGKIPRRHVVNVPVLVSTSMGIAGYLAFPLLESPETSNVDGRGGSSGIFVVAALLGVSQMGAIVCSLSSLSEGVLATDRQVVARSAPNRADEDTSQDSPEDEDAPLLHDDSDGEYGTLPVPVSTVGPVTASRIRLKGSIAGVYSWCGGLAILLLTKLGGFLFDHWTPGAPFYMMAVFNGMLLLASLGLDAGRTLQIRARYK